jgi:hypothetical protein
LADNFSGNAPLLGHKMSKEGEYSIRKDEFIQVKKGTDIYEN